MNKESIAMASDSAVTSSNGKIYTNANKLFMLSRFHPVGIMIYGNASFMDVPLETIIKQYRQDLGKKEFDYISDYLMDFIIFLLEKCPFLNNKVQTEILMKNVLYILENIKILFLDRLNQELKNHIARTQTVPNLNIIDILNNFTSDIVNRLNQCTFVPHFDQSFVNPFIQRYHSDITTLINNTFSFFNISLDQVILERIEQIICYTLIKLHNIINLNETGIVISGFGKKEIYPSTVSIEIRFILEKQLIFYNFKKFSINSNESSQIIPYAQGDMISLFMLGIYPPILDFFNGYIQNHLRTYSERILDQIPNLDPNIRTEILNISERNRDPIYNEFQNGVMQFINQYFNSITKACSILPKEELGIMAETLVNLTSFKRKMSMEQESVGGPTDLAIISKGDGFVWIKRKHYFKSEFNLDYIRNINNFPDY